MRQPPALAETAANAPLLFSSTPRIVVSKYGKGSIPEVTLEDMGDRVNISVRDEGAPIPKKYAKKIFRRFFRMPTRDTRRQSGVGLGLYIVKTIARMNKGTIVLGPVDGSSESRGNRFILSLPRSP